MQKLDHMTEEDYWVQGNVGAEERDRIFAGMINAWKMDEVLRKKILEAKTIPPIFADREAPGMMSGMNYVLEEQDYPPLFALFKSDTTIRFVPGTPDDYMDRAIEETHAVYRLLRAKAREGNPQ
jgi:hypothetical protein